LLILFMKLQINVLQSSFWKFCFRKSLRRENYYWSLYSHKYGLFDRFWRMVKEELVNFKLWICQSQMYLSKARDLIGLFCWFIVFYKIKKKRCSTPFLFVESLVPKTKANFLLGQILINPLEWSRCSCHHKFCQDNQSQFRPWWLCKKVPHYVCLCQNPKQKYLSYPMVWK